MIPPPPRSTPFPYTTLFRSHQRTRRRLPPGPHRHPHSERDAGHAATERGDAGVGGGGLRTERGDQEDRSEEHTSELQSPCNLVCRLLLEKKKKRAQDLAREH